MAEYPALPLWTDAYLADTLDLATEEHGVYLLMLMLAWRRPNCALPNDLAGLKRMLGGCCRDMHGNRFNRIVPKLISQFFEVGKDGELHQKRLGKERDYLRKQSETQRDRVNKRWANKKEINSLSDTAVVPAGNTPTPTPTPTPNSKKKSPSDSSHVTVALDEWNTLAEEISLTKVQKLTEDRKRRLKARLGDCGGIEGWRAALEKIRQSRFCKGQNGSGWKIDFDFLIRESSFVKLMEGNYDERKKCSGNGSLADSFEKVDAVIEELRRRENGSREEDGEENSVSIPGLRQGAGRVSVDDN